jgi:hypothetical protein
MARYKEYSYDQGKLIPITFHKQIVPGTFEFALNPILTKENGLPVIYDLWLLSKFENLLTGFTRNSV